MVKIKVILNLGYIGSIEIIGDHEELRTELPSALDVIFSNKETIEETAEELGKIFSSKTIGIPSSVELAPPVTEEESFYSKLSHFTGIEEEKIQTILHFSKDEEISLLIPASKLSNRKAVLLAALAIRGGLGLTKIELELCKQIFIKSGFSISNFGRAVSDMKKYKEISKGTERGAPFELTKYGINKAIEVINQFD